MATEKKFVVVTGATRGLGRAMVDRLVEAGHTVAGCGRNDDAIAQLRAVYPEPHHFAVVDVSRDDDVADWANEVLQRNGPPDLLLNNAALVNRNAPLWEVPVHEFDNVIDVNIKGVANVIRHFVPAMIARQKGVIVNFSSGWGRSTSPDVAPYCATKWAMEGLSQALAQELPKGMAAVALNPGIINTDMLQSCFASGANSFPPAEEWSHAAVPYLLRLGPADNGRPCTAPSP